MQEFSRIICIGYSFPQTDFDVRTPIRRFRLRLSKVPEVHFVSPDQKAESRLKGLLGIREVKRFKNLSEYLG